MPQPSGVPGRLVQINPELLLGLGLLQLGQATATTPTAPEPPTATVSLQDALARIPTAQSGDPIGPEYHNSLREFCRVVTLAQGGDVSTALTVNITPALLPVGENPPWTVTIGASTNTAGAVQGWLPVTLPERTVVVDLAVSGRRTSATAGRATVSLLRAALEDPEDRVTLASVGFDVRGDDGTFTTPPTAARPAVPQVTDEQARAYLTVDPARYRYLLFARTVTATASALDLTNVRVTCNRF
jgi:hypothetical protein